MSRRKMVNHMLNLSQKMAQKMKEMRNKSQDAAVVLLTEKVTPEVQAARFNICVSCSEFNEILQNCNLCGCFMRVKTWMPNQKCPVDKWLQADVDTSKGS